jgi:hypothetical protein
MSCFAENADQSEERGRHGSVTAIKRKRCVSRLLAIAFAEVGRSALHFLGLIGLLVFAYIIRKRVAHSLSGSQVRFYRRYRYQ